MSMLGLSLRSGRPISVCIMLKANSQPGFARRPVSAPSTITIWSWTLANKWRRNSMAASNPPAEPRTPTIGQPANFVGALLFRRANPDPRACDRRRAVAWSVCRFEAMAVLIISYGYRLFKVRFQSHPNIIVIGRSRWSRTAARNSRRISAAAVRAAVYRFLYISGEAYGRTSTDV